MVEIYDFITNCLVNHPWQNRKKFMRAASQLIMMDVPIPMVDSKAVETKDSASKDITFEVQGKFAKYNPIQNTFAEMGELYVEDKESPSEGILLRRRIGYDVSDMILEMMEGYSAAEKNIILSICCAFSLDDCTEEQKTILAGIIAGESNEPLKYAWIKGGLYGFIDLKKGVDYET